MRSSSSRPPQPEDPVLPEATRWLFRFQACNAFNFTVAIGAPLVLTARFLGAGESIIGLLTALAFLMAVLQIFATAVIDRYGPRQLMLWGWGLRSFALLIVVPLPLLIGRVPSPILVGLLVLAIFFYTGIRGFAAGAWLPWLNQMLPEKTRGYYLGLEQRIVSLSAFVTLVGAGIFLGHEPPPWRYSLLFVIATAVGWRSVYYLAKTPPEPPSPHIKPLVSSLREMWQKTRRVWAHKPFRRTTRFVGVFTFAIAAVPGFLVLYLREELGWGEGTILGLQSIATIGVLWLSVTWGRLSDRLGSRPLMRIGAAGMTLWVIFWLLPALGLVTPGLIMAGLTYLLWGVFVSMHSVGQGRIVLNCCPPEEITFGMALFQVIISLCGGGAPLLWGVILQALRTPAHAIPGPQSFAFSLMFIVTLLLCLLSQVLLTRIPEARYVPTRQVLVQAFFDWPARVVSGVLVGGRKKP